MTDISTRRTEAETRLTELKHRQGVALLDDQEFDHTPLDAVEKELAALDAAEGEAVRRQREQAAKAEEARRTALKEKLERLNQDRLDAAERAEEAARAFTEASKEWIARNADCARIVRALNKTGGGAMLLDAGETEMRLSQMLTCALKPLFGLRRKLGMIVFPDPWSRYAGEWKETERTNTESEILAVLKG
ncbi:hypothetical protein [Mesorhizobium sp.]|uniref:hypothetical protein n=1 Tax=Mesorhizobium sp. TaxID=1871066 RepID=UPI0011FC2EEA|nr:hypothetical protein [Mesorhizobium sp.]TIL43414.1 MAG: hypothetical protein E5Y86_22475 [Mesorhizobium sp.]